MKYSQYYSINVAELLFHSMTTNPFESFYMKDLQSHFITMSLYHATYFGLQSIEEGIGKSDFDFFTKPHAQQSFADEQQIIRTGSPILGKVERETWDNDLISYVITSKHPLYDLNQKIIGTWGHSVNVATGSNNHMPIRQKQMHQEPFEEYLSQTSQQDPLTGLLNVKAFYETMNLYYQLAMNCIQEPNMTYGLIFVSIDDYHDLLSSHGHYHTDQILLYTAQHLDTLKNENTHVFRYNANCFALLIHASSYEQVINVAQSLFNDFSESPLQYNNQSHFIKFSIGISQFKESLPLGNIYDIINLSEKRLYAAQHIASEDIIYNDSY